MKYILSVLFILIGTTASANKEIMKDATKKLKESGIEKKAVNLGMQVPNFKLGEKPVTEFYQQQNLVLKFYRGGWCPYCMTELKDYQSLEKQFKDAGCSIVGITPDLVKEIKKTKKKHQIGFDIFRDENNKIAKKFGLAFQLEKRLLPIYKKYGIELEKYQGNTNNELPMPGTYIVDKNGKIRYAFLDADYTKRAPAKDVLKECRKL